MDEISVVWGRCPATVLSPLIASKATFDLKVALNDRLFLGINTLLGGIPKTWPFSAQKTHGFLSKLVVRIMGSTSDHTKKENGEIVELFSELETCSKVGHMLGT